MREILILKDIADSFRKNPRDATLFGEEEIVVTDTRRYDLYYAVREGIRLAPSDKTIKPVPVFLYPGDMSSLMRQFDAYNKQNHNNVAGVCDKDDTFALYSLKRKSEGLETHIIREYNVVDLEEFLKRMSAFGSYGGLGKEIQEKISKIEI